MTFLQTRNGEQIWLDREFVRYHSKIKESDLNKVITTNFTKETIEKLIGLTSYYNRTTQTVTDQIKRYRSLDQSWFSTEEKTIYQSLLQSSDIFDLFNAAFLLGNDMVSLFVVRAFFHRKCQLFAKT